MSGKPFCIRCLIRELCDSDKLRIIDEYKNNLAIQLIADNETYESRLMICKDCKNLNMGTCSKNGSYVEAWAYDISKKCPLRQW